MTTKNAITVGVYGFMAFLYRDAKGGCYAEKGTSREGVFEIYVNLN